MDSETDKRYHNVNVILDSRNAESGNWTDFKIRNVFQTVPTKIEKIGVYFTSGSYVLNQMNPMNNTISVAIVNDSQVYNMTFLNGRYIRGPATSTRYSYPSSLQTLLNANPFGAVFTVTLDPFNDIFSISSTLAFKFINIPSEHTFTFGLENMTSFVTSYVTPYADFIFSPNIYVSSNALSRFSNSNIVSCGVPNVIALVRFSDIAFVSQTGTVYDNNVYDNVIFMRFDESTPLANGFIDITLYTDTGRKLSEALESPYSRLGYFTIQFKCVTNTT